MDLTASIGPPLGETTAGENEAVVSVEVLAVAEDTAVDLKIDTVVRRELSIRWLDVTAGCDPGWSMWISDVTRPLLVRQLLTPADCEGPATIKPHDWRRPAFHVPFMSPGWRHVKVRDVSGRFMAE